MKNVWGRLPIGLRERPFDMLTAILLFGFALYVFLDPNFPEKHEDSVSNVLVNVLAVYIMAAGAAIIAATLVNPKKKPFFSYYGQMYGWAFMAAATAAVCLFQIYNALVSEQYGVIDITLFGAVLTAWIVITLVSVIRSLDMLVSARRFH